MNSELKYRQYVLNKLVSNLEGFDVYYNPQFKSWWWINPETKEWRFEFKKTGSLYWYYGWGDNFRMKYSLDDSEFEEMISRYVEQILQNRVVDTGYRHLNKFFLLEHIFQNRVTDTLECRQPYKRFVEDMISKESECTFNVNYTIKHGFENEPR